MQKPQLVAVDTNVLMRLAIAHEPTVDACSLIKRRLHPVQFIVPPTVLAELANKAAEDPEQQVRETALSALHSLRSDWRFLPVELNAVQEAIARNAIQQLSHSGLLPYEERNDAAVICESAILSCILLVSRDSHLLDIDHQKLALLFRELDLLSPVIVSPETLLKKFYS